MLHYYQFKEVSELYAQNRSEKARELLADLQARYITVCDENANLRLRIQEFENLFYLAKNMIFDGRFYWLITGSIKQGPFCPHCYDCEGALIRLHHREDDWVCSVCNLTLEHAQHRPAPHREARSAKVIPFAR